jgi:hypothetical protein
MNIHKRSKKVRRGSTQEHSAGLSGGGLRRGSMPSLPTAGSSMHSAGLQEQAAGDSADHDPGLEALRPQPSSAKAGRQHVSQCTLWGDSLTVAGQLDKGYSFRPDPCCELVFPGDILGDDDLEMAASSQHSQRQQQELQQEQQEQQKKQKQQANQQQELNAQRRGGISQDLWQDVANKKQHVTHGQQQHMQQQEMVKPIQHQHQQHQHLKAASVCRRWSSAFARSAQVTLLELPAAVYRSILKAKRDAFRSKQASRAAQLDARRALGRGSVDLAVLRLNLSRVPFFARLSAPAQELALVKVYVFMFSASAFSLRLTHLRLNSASWIIIIVGTGATGLP